MSHVRIRCTGLIVENNSVLLVEYDDNGIHYNLPGGGLEPGETILEGVAREVLEETTVQVDVGPLALIYEFTPHKQSGDYNVNENHGLKLIFECILKNNSRPRLPQNPDPHQSGVKWSPLEEVDSILLRSLSFYLFQSVLFVTILSTYAGRLGGQIGQLESDLI